MIIGKALAEKIIEQVTTHPEQHNQGIWHTDDED